MFDLERNHAQGKLLCHIDYIRMRGESNKYICMHMNVYLNEWMWKNLSDVGKDDGIHFNTFLQIMNGFNLHC